MGREICHILQDCQVRCIPAGLGGFLSISVGERTVLLLQHYFIFIFILYFFQSERGGGEFAPLKEHRLNNLIIIKYFRNYVFWETFERVSADTGCVKM